MKTEDGFEKQLYGITTIIKSVVTKDNKQFTSQGSAFYYNEEIPVGDVVNGHRWHKLDKQWLVTNRHVVLPTIEGVECVPDSFVFCFRKVDQGKVNWYPIALSKDELLSNLKLHSQKNIDVALIDITSYFRTAFDEMAENNTRNMILPIALSNLNLPENQPIQIEVASDIIVASYPKGFYDDVNKFPIVKSGIIASAWGLNFRGEPIFQIDAQLFPGSSGGLVISKPMKINNSKTKKFVLLGIYSGEYMWDKEIDIEGRKTLIKASYGLGNVWYSNLIPEIIKNGISYSG